MLKHRQNTKGNQLTEPEAAKSPSRSPKCCKPTQCRHRNDEGILRGKQHPKRNNGGPYENARRPRASDMQECYKPKSTCPRRSPRPALVLPEPHCSSKSVC